MLVELQHFCQDVEAASGQRCQGRYAQPVLLMLSIGRAGTRPQQRRPFGRHSALVSNASPLPVSETCCSWPRASFCVYVMHVMHVMHHNAQPGTARMQSSRSKVDDALASAPQSGRKPGDRPPEQLCTQLDCHPSRENLMRDNIMYAGHTAVGGKVHRPAAALCLGSMASQPVHHPTWA